MSIYPTRDIVKNTSNDKANYLQQKRHVKSTRVRAQKVNLATVGADYFVRSYVNNIG